MRLFCLLWMPLFYLFWSALMPKRNTGAGGILALILGSTVALILFFLGSFVQPGGFGLSRWISGFVDIAGVPVLLPLAAYLLLLPFGGSKDFANFALLWLIPDAAIRQVSWNVQNNPILLVLVPLLRTALVVGISFCINLIMSRRIPAGIAVMGILLLPFTGATSYWAFFSQQASWGFLLFGITSVPMAVWIPAILYRYYRET